MSDTVGVVTHRLILVRLLAPRNTATRDSEYVVVTISRQFHFRADRLM
jgi:hypothetical protein